MAAKWFDWTGKPSGSLALTYNRYSRLDAKLDAPPEDGSEDRLLYLNVNPNWVLPKSDPLYRFQNGVIRVRWTRAGAKPDPTAYQTFVLTTWESTLITHTHWEQGEASRGGFWSMRVRGHLKHSGPAATVTTRYAKGRLL